MIIIEKQEKIESFTVISTVPASMNTLLEGLTLPKKWGRILTNREMLVEGSDHIWAVGDCACIPLANGEVCPTTAQFAIREAKTLAYNIALTIDGKKRKPFYFKSFGMLGAVGHHNAFGELFGFLKLSGCLAWIFWRVVYWVKLPGAVRKTKVALSWFLDAIFPSELVQLKTIPSQGITKLH